METAHAPEAQAIEDVRRQELALQTQAKGGRRRGKRRLLLVGLAVALVGGGGIVAKRVLLGHPQNANGRGQHAQRHYEPGPILDLGEEFIVNLQGGGYVRARVALELGVQLRDRGFGAGPAPEFMAPLRDLVITVLSSRSRSELNTAAGKEKAKKELIERINEDFAERGYEGFARKAYFTYFAVQ